MEKGLLIKAEQLKGKIVQKHIFLKFISDI